MRWLKENVVRLVSFVVREPMLFVQYIVLASIALVMFTLVMHYKINKSVKKQEKIRKQKEKILRKLHGSRKKAEDEAQIHQALEKDKDE
ncbi:unnamed protein product [Heligmosomoides polygyrus]|uniref:Small integral membrane protein 15 n=1 Tax=Heligmosomoides polygyrus TaxID=6339 RepID=A0A183GC28_HELPZ|nr:unnamed protein product [Heligmosomoides polygyrus]